MLKSTLLLFVATLIAVVTLANAASAQQPAAAPAAATAPAQKNPVKATAESQAKAKQIFSNDCSMCHNDNGNGKSDLATSMSLTLPDLSDPKTLDSVPDADLFILIRNGKDKMPGEDAGRAKDNDIWNLVTYVRNLSKVPGASTAAK